MTSYKNTKRAVIIIDSVMLALALLFILAVAINCKARAIYAYLCITVGIVALASIMGIVGAVVRKVSFFLILSTFFQWMFIWFDGNYLIFNNHDVDDAFIRATTYIFDGTLIAMCMLSTVFHVKLELHLDADYSFYEERQLII